MEDDQSQRIIDLGMELARKLEETELRNVRLHRQNEAMRLKINKMISGIEYHLTSIRRLLLTSPETPSSSPLESQH